MSTDRPCTKTATSHSSRKRTHSFESVLRFAPGTGARGGCTYSAPQLKRARAPPAAMNVKASERDVLVPIFARDGDRRVRRQWSTSRIGVFKRGCGMVGRSNINSSSSSSRASSLSLAARNSARICSNGRALWFASSVFRFVKSATASWLLAVT